MRRHIIGAGVLALALGVTACSGSGSDTAGETIKVAYQQFGEGKVMAKFLAGVKSEFEKANPGKTVQLLAPGRLAHSGEGC